MHNWWEIHWLRIQMSQKDFELWPWAKLCGSKAPEVKEIVGLTSSCCRSTDDTLSSCCSWWSICPGLCLFPPPFPPSELIPFASPKFSDSLWVNSLSCLCRFCLGESASVSASDSPSFTETYNREKCHGALRSTQTFICIQFKGMMTESALRCMILAKNTSKRKAMWQQTVCL